MIVLSSLGGMFLDRSEPLTVVVSHPIQRKQPHEPDCDFSLFLSTALQTQVTQPEA